ncbi:hypothetical protein EVAR_17540_1 [Eumeta japonica]|uniref:Uncharacterized protein n=1 Tax=Eumeta variegata TaxID=151549 RepID=A0A4C1WTV1_EUMVA|nr:hypothetical protein EVAR_17540_1 [Eumeta japonica]
MIPPYIFAAKPNIVFDLTSRGPSMSWLDGSKHGGLRLSHLGHSPEAPDCSRISMPNGPNPCWCPSDFLCRENHLKGSSIRGTFLVGFSPTLSARSGARVGVEPRVARADTSAGNFGFVLTLLKPSYKHGARRRHGEARSLTL